ncbi:MAG: radical SAM/SPASM domain-containing protein [Thermoleophilia bacterium]
MIESVNFSLSGACSADCIFCPDHRASSMTPKNMPFDSAAQMIDELSSSSFQNRHHLKRIVVGENGDSFMNPRFIDILRLMKEKLPRVPVELTTNFQLATEEKLAPIVREKLIDSCVCNIDGATARTYNLVKGLDYEKVSQHVGNFLALRKEHQQEIPFVINILTYHDYVHTIKKYLKVYPLKMKDPSFKDIPDDFAENRKQLKEIINPETDWIVRTWIYGWAEREQMAGRPINYKKYGCPNIRRVERETFVAPDGSWYACCMDADYANSLGNVIETSFDEVYDSPRRAEFISLLRSRQFDKIDGPCQTVNCCQLLHGKRVVSEAVRIAMKYPRMVDYYCDLTSKPIPVLSSVLKPFSSLPYMRVSKDEDSAR